MLLQRESNPSLNTVTAYGHDYIEINEVTFRHAVHFAPEGPSHSLAATQVGDIDAALLRTIAGLVETASDPLAFLDDRPSIQRPAEAPELIIIGTGSRQHFLPAPVTGPLLSLGIGIEVMTTQAAARTYNILMAEGRRVVAALLPTEEHS